MKTKLLLIVVCLFVYASSMATWGQETEPEKGQLWYCFEVTVNPSMNNQFYSLETEGRTFFEENNFAHAYYVWTDNNFHYFFFYPVESYEDINKIHEATGAIMQKWGEEKINKWRETVDYHRDYFIRFQPDISYMPEAPRLKEGEGDFAIWDISYISPGKENEINALAKEFAALLKAKKYDDDFQFYTGGLGFGGSIFIGVLKGKDPSDFWAQNKKMWELIGEEGRKIFQSWMLLVNKREFKQFWYLKDLSYIPE